MKPLGNFRSLVSAPSRRLFEDTPGRAERASALEFSFFLSMPTMVAATGYDLLKTLRNAQASPLGAVQMTPHGWVVLGIGLLVSFIVAYGVVAWFMSWVRRRGFAPFAIYRIAVGAAVLLWIGRAAR